MKLSFTPLNLDRNRELILQYRADSFLLSFGDTTLFYGDDGLGAERYLSLIAARSRLSGSCVHVLSDKGTIIGQVELRPRIVSGRETGYVNLFYLAEGSRGKGLASQLDDYARDFFRKLNLNDAYLNVSPSNLRAISFYRKAGWQDVELIEKNKHSVLVMRKVYR